MGHSRLLAAGLRGALGRGPARPRRPNKRPPKPNAPPCCGVRQAQFQTALVRERRLADAVRIKVVVTS
jgi:hypothetical protein